MPRVLSSIPELEPSGPHLAYLLLSLFLILYALFAEFIRNRLHLSEPPLATLTGIGFGPVAVDLLGSKLPTFQDNITQELARVVTAVQCFAVGIDLPSGYVKRHWKGLLLLLVPNMTFGWIASAVIVHYVLQVSWSTAFIVAACLTPTDPVLSASVLGEAKFSTRVPKRLRHILSAESGCNDGTAFPFLYAIVFAVIKNDRKEWAKEFFLETILWQCIAGIAFGIVIGFVANKALRFSRERNYTQDATLFVFYFLLALFTVGVGSTLGLDDFLVAFSAGTTFAWDGWFNEQTAKMKLPSILDLLLNSAMFVYFGTIIPWTRFVDNLSYSRLFIAVVLVLFFRRFPSILALKAVLSETRTWSEALFAGHFGPMGVGAMFLAMEARGQLENENSTPDPHPPQGVPHQEAIDTVWPAVAAIVLGSIFVHGFSAVVMSVYGHIRRPKKKRNAVVGGESDMLEGMDEHEIEEDEINSPAESESEDDTTKRNGQVRIE